MSIMVSVAVYCLQRSDTTDMAYVLQTKGVNATYYHGALDPYKKRDIFQAWQEGKASVMCATVAFGMGRDKPDDRFVIHLSIPKSLECYAQEFGRAGRDSESSQCFLFFRFEDRTKHLQMISSLPEGDHRSLKLTELNDVVKMCLKKCNNMQAVEVLNCLQSMIRVHPKITFNLLVLVYQGSKRREVLAKSFQNITQYGKGKNIFSDSSLQHFIQMLISENIAEKLRGTNEYGSMPFFIPGDKAVAMSNGELLIYKYKV